MEWQSVLRPRKIYFVVKPSQKKTVKGFTMVATEDKSLLLLLQDPESRSRAFDQLVRQYQRTLYFHIRRLVIEHEDADDVLQNTFIKAWRYIGNFRGEASLKTWLYRIATNEALSFLQKKKKQAFTDIGDLNDSLQHSLKNGSYIDGDKIQICLQEAILTLPDRQRLVFNMRYFDELKYSEIAKILELSEGALKASYHHAAKKVEKYLQEQALNL
jgi:RNA polymerase sigma-70 factor (ECF subfamily)